MAGNPNRRGGIAYLKIDGVQQELKGNWSYRPSFEKKTAIKANSAVAGFKGEWMEPYLEGEFVNSQKLDLNKLVNIENATVTLVEPTGKTFILSEAWYAGDGIGNTEEGNVAVRFEGKTGEEIPA
jgi:hypothetical protein